MATPRERELADYVKKYKIVEVMDNLTSMLLFYKPENPREFLIDQLEQMQAAQQKSLEQPCLFDDSNLDSIFRIMDPVNQGYITLAQYREALSNLRINNINECPKGAEEDKISIETFKEEARKGLRKRSATSS